MLTDRDIVVRAVASGQDPTVTPVRRAMTAGVVRCHEDRDVREAARLMEERQIRRLLVLDSADEPVGIVSLGDPALHTHGAPITGEILERVAEPAHARS
jgi:CBS domain-containing protein